MMFSIRVRSVASKLKRLIIKNGDDKVIPKLLKKYYRYSHKRKRKVKLAIIISSSVNTPRSSSFIRIFSPFTSKELSKFSSIDVFGEDTIRLDKNYDACILQRTAISNVEKASILVKNLSLSKTRLIIDSDDAFNVIDNSHPEFEVLSQKKEAFELLINKADAIWLSTNRLTEAYPNTTKKPTVIKNTIDPRLWGNTPNGNGTSKKLKLVYMGTATHDADLELIIPALDKLFEKWPNSFTLTVIGVSKDIPSRDWIRREVPANGSIYPEFVKWFTANSDYDIGLAPLVDNEFNKAKSDIKCLDYLAAGILPFTSDVEPYSSKELDPYITRIRNNNEQWIQAIDDVLNDIAGFRKAKRHKIQNAREYIRNKRDVSYAAAQIKASLEEVLKP